MPGSLELAGIKGRKTISCPRPLGQESVAPGDGVRSHKAGVGPGLGAGPGTGECENSAAGTGGRCPLPGWVGAFISSAFREGLSGAREPVPEEGGAWLFPRTAGACPPHGPGRRHPAGPTARSGQTGAMEGEGAGWAISGGVTQSNRILTRMPVHGHTPAGRRPPLSWLQPRKLPGGPTPAGWVRAEPACRPPPLSQVASRPPAAFRGSEWGPAPHRRTSWAGGGGRRAVQ